VDWTGVDDFLDQLVHEDAALEAARASRDDVPAHEVAPNQGALLALLVQMCGARRVLEVGTLIGYSTIWLARAVGADGTVTTLELDPGRAEQAQANLQRAGVAERVDVVVGPARESLQDLADRGVPAYDFVFLDADKPNNPHYLEQCLALSQPGTVIVADNVVRDGAICDATSQDPSVVGVRRFLEMVRRHPRLEATAVQTVGRKGWDGFLIARVR
jgi:predicted O-methyltransferase YrrM